MATLPIDLCKVTEVASEVLQGLTAPKRSCRTDFAYHKVISRTAKLAPGLLEARAKGTNLRSLDTMSISTNDFLGCNTEMQQFSTHYLLLQRGSYGGAWGKDTPDPR